MKEILPGNAMGDDAVTLAFGSTPGALYYIDVSDSWTEYGDFELVVREE
jgi:hypothetical protein